MVIMWNLLLLSAMFDLNGCLTYNFPNSTDALGNQSVAFDGATRYRIARFDWTSVSLPFTVILWILLAVFAKIGFNSSKRLASIFPDSSLLILLGVLMGLLLFWLRINESVFQLSSKVFFLFLLPPIMLDAGYFMPNRAFFDNLGTILVYAVLGTLWSAVTTGRLKLTQQLDDSLISLKCERGHELFYIILSSL